MLEGWEIEIAKRRCGEISDTERKRSGRREGKRGDLRNRERDEPRNGGLNPQCQLVTSGKASNPKS